MRDKAYGYLALVFEMVEAKYDAPASRLLDYVSKHFWCIYLNLEIF